MTCQLQKSIQGTGQGCWKSLTVDKTRPRAEPFMSKLPGLENQIKGHPK